MSRPGRPGQSCACGALIKSWNELRSEGVTCNCKIPGGERWREQEGVLGPPAAASLSHSPLPQLAARPPHRSPSLPLLPAAHDAVDPEYSILKQRIARRLRHEGETDESVQALSLVDVTKVAERTISDDLEYLISKTVDTSKADYAGGWGCGWGWEWQRRAVERLSACLCTRLLAYLPPAGSPPRLTFCSLLSSSPLPCSHHGRASAQLGERL
jgi:hypothetical protein